MKTNETIAYLIRHADRDPFPKNSFGNEVLLNEIGTKKAIQYGEKLSNHVITKIYTSPIERCVQTAECIMQGYGKPIQIITTKVLGAPGIHINDEKIAGDFFLKYGLKQIYQQFIEGKKLPGFASKKELFHNLTTFIQQNSITHQTTLFITHDLLIALYHFAYSGFIYENNQWIEFLEGLYLKKAEINTLKLDF